MQDLIRTRAPFVRVFGADGTLVAASTSRSTTDRVGEATFRAGDSGAFTVVTSAYYRNWSGAYVLTLAVTP